MATGMASVSLAQVESGKGVCDTAIHELQSIAKELDAGLSDASTGWRDEQYGKFAAIVGDCKSAILSPISELNTLKDGLSKLAQAISDYESTAF